MTPIRQHAVAGLQWSTPNGTHDQKDETAVYNENVFTDDVAKELMAAEDFERFTRTLEAGEPIGPDVADSVATAMLEWATRKGATHYTHWFQPLTGRTAEKHDSFYEPKGTKSLAKFK